MNRYAYLYRYNNRNLCTWKKLPGVEPVEYVYDNHDRLAFSQDGNQRASGKWTFYVYDHMNRLVQQRENTSKTVSASYTEKVTSYDKNGNIKALKRYGNGLIDNLTYTYSGNQLTRVDDATGNAASILLLGVVSSVYGVLSDTATSF